MAHEKVSKFSHRCLLADRLALYGLYGHVFRKRKIFAGILGGKREMEPVRLTTEMNSLRAALDISCGEIMDAEYKWKYGIRMAGCPGKSKGEFQNQAQETTEIRCSSFADI
ncbi:MAG: hypothetical protein DRG25_03960 [Deltaproteobacteria bacterium]|nr:MAG: hypothetical protein DRG25_03960 [Deltaproteobacteria bacterium]